MPVITNTTTGRYRRGLIAASLHLERRPVLRITLVKASKACSGKNARTHWPTTLRNGP